jgi:hypothetical protein
MMLKLTERPIDHLWNQTDRFDRRSTADRKREIVVAKVDSQLRCVHPWTNLSDVDPDGRNKFVCIEAANASANRMTIPAKVNRHSRRPYRSYRYTSKFMHGDWPRMLCDCLKTGRSVASIPREQFQGSISQCVVEFGTTQSQNRLRWFFRSWSQKLRFLSL